MKKTVLIMVIIIFAMMTIAISEVEASAAGISCGNATVGEDFTVSFVMPEGAIAIEGDIVVTFSDGSQQSGRIVYVPGYSQNAATFKAAVQGTTTIKANNIEITAASGEIMEQGGSASKQITIAGAASNPGTTPSTPTTPTTPKESQPEPEPTFTAVNETVYAVQSCNVRESYSTNSNKIGGLQAGQSVTRTGIGSNGWSKILYNGKIAYVKTTLLTKEEPVIEEEPEEIPEEQNEALIQIQNEVGVLPEVGNNIAVILYIAISLITISIVCYLGYRLKNK